MSKKPTLSPSRITTFLACPVKYRWTYVDSRGRWYMRSKSHYSFGATLHRVLELFHSTDGVGVETTAEVLAAVEENWVDAGYHSAEEMADALGEGKAILERYVAEARTRETTAKTLFVEKTFRYEMDDFILLGRVDRVDEHEDGTLEIVDYKSGREEVSESDVASDIAMSCYQLLLKRRYPDRPVVATIVALRSGRTASWSMGEDELAEFEADIYRIGQDIISDDFFDRTPKPKGLCPKCDFLPLCRKHPEYEESLSALQEL